MIYLITIIVLLISLILISNKNKNYFLIYSLLLLIFAGNNANADFFVYERIYNNIDASNNLEVGYVLLMKISNFFGFSYQTFIFLISIAGLFLITKTFKPFVNINYLLVCYAFYPFLLDVTQVRYFLATSIFISVIPALVSNSRWGKVKYIFGVLLASTFHFLAIIFLIFLVVNSKFKKTYVTVISAFVLLISVVTIISGNKLPFLTLIFNIFDDSKYIVYFQQQVNFGFLIPIFYYLASIFLLVWSLKLLKMRGCLEENHFELKFTKTVLYLHLISLVFIPLFFIDLQFIRLYRGLCILKYAAFAITDSKLKKGTVVRYQYNIMVFLFVIINFIVELIFQDRFDRVFKVIFENNLIFNFLQ